MNRAQRRANKRRNPTDGRDDALKRGRKTLRDPKPANSAERDARARK